MRQAARPRKIDVNNVRAMVGRIVIGNAAQHAFDDVDVMLSAIQVHAWLECTCNAAPAFARALGRDKPRQYW